MALRPRDARTRRLGFVVGAVSLAFGTLGCGAEFDRVSEIESLRLFALQKSSPYAQPGETVRLSLLFEDATPGTGTAERKVTIGWLSGCFNPPGDIYAGCFADPLKLSPLTGPGTPAELELTIPDDIILPRQPLPYGLAYVFVAVCAGQLAFDTSGAQGLPVRCRDDAGRDLGSDDFVVGYSAIYVFGNDRAGVPYANANPEVTGFALKGTEVANRCLGDECLADCSDPAVGCVTSPAPVVDCAEPGAPCVPACPDDGDSVLCEGYDIRPLIDPSSAEFDAISRDAYGDNYQEQMWINYYVTRGSVKSDVRLLNDATKGWNADFGTEFYPPSAPGPVKVWAVAHDNRGGMSWASATIQVE